MCSKFTISIPKTGMFLFVCIHGLLNGSYQLNAQNIPDANFAAAIRTACPTCIDTSNNLLPPATSLTTLDVSNKNIANLTGIGGFIGLKELYCGRNQLSALPSLPSDLKILSCFSNRLTTLPNLPESLQALDCNTNQLTQLPNLPAGFKSLYCPYNQIYCLPDLPGSLSTLVIDINKIKCLPNVVTDLKVYDAFNSIVYFPLCTQACSNAACTPPATPSLTASPSTIKVGESSTLAANNCTGTVTWNTGQTGSSITVSPTSPMSYRAFCTVDGCSSSYANVSISIACEVPTPSLLATPNTISLGDSSILTAAGCAGSLTWYPSSGGASIGTGNSITIKPTQSGSYSANCIVGSCLSNSFVQVSVSCSAPSPNILATPNIITTGTSSTLTATGCIGIVNWWSNNTAGPPIGTGNSLTVTPAQTTNYYANCTMNNCTSNYSSVQIIVPCTINTPSVSASPSTIIIGQSASLTATGCIGTLTWFKVGQGSSIGTGSTVTVSPTSTTEYYAFCNLNGCGSNDAHVTVNLSCEVPATPSLTASPSNLTLGQNSTLSATNCLGTVKWSTGETGNSISVSPSQTGSYSATCTLNGCQSQASLVQLYVGSSTCNPPPTPSVKANLNDITLGQSVTLTAANCSGLITWENTTDQITLGTGNSIIVTPSKNTYYRAYCTANGCNSSVALILINIICTIPTPSVSVSPNIIIPGGSATLNASNCNGTVNWFKSGVALGITGNSLSVTPAQTSTYAATCTVDGCTSNKAFAYVQVTCTAPPTPSLSATPGIIKAGQNSTLTAVGCAGTLRWYNATDGGPSTLGTSIIVSPAKTTFYVGECNLNGCVSISNVSVTILCTPPPTPSVVASPSAVSAGQNTTLSATNCAGTTTWFKSGTVNSIGTGNSITAVVTQSSYYYAYCTVNGCQSNSSGVNVNILCAVPPTPSVLATPNTISSGQSATLTATGCTGTVTWYNSAGGASLGTGNSFVVSPVNLTTYTAYCNVNTCSSGGANVEVVVATNPCPPTKTLTGTISTPSPMTETASVSIESTQIIQPNTNVTYRSPVILLKPGTEIQQGAIFKTEQGGCN